MRQPVWLAPMVLCACATARPASAKPAAAVQYRVDLTAAASQYMHVEATVPSGSATTKLALPAWTPGSYKIRDFSKHVFGFSAESLDGTALEVEAVDKQTWEVRNGGRPFVARYRVYAATPSVRTSMLDDTHASINGASVFVFEPGKLRRPHRVEVSAPQGWSIHTALPSRDGSFVADDYDILVDSPIEVGTPAIDRFELGGTAFEYVLTSPEDLKLDRARLVEESKAVSSAFAEMMGGFPMQRYVFLMNVGDVGGGGLEHAQSTMMMMSRTAFDKETGYDAAARLTAHEFFHLWNVKRIHDAALGPFDYQHENYSRLLWFHEGFTETMESLAMRRSGLWTAQEYLEHIASRITGLERKPGRNAMALSEVSFRAWTHAYQPENNHRNETVSYYEKGDIVGVALDLTIRLESEGKGSLPGVFRRLMARFGAVGKGITAGDIKRAASAEAGVDLSDFFARHVDGVEPVPLLPLLEKAGVVVESRPVWSNADGTDTTRAASKRAWAGLQLQGMSVRNVVPGSPAEAGEVMRGDEVIAVQGRRVKTEAALRTALGRVGPGARGVLTVFRGSRLLELELELQDNPHRIVTLELPDEPSSVLRGWLALD
ncbi:MAG: PDZ domain-containing protein [Nannocystaceae bacterium]|nr:PDZ domain-containing protein [Nannocystaceae bacterium]